jgi:predicted TIM-barrel fold metal-dependent hydrolase
VTLSPEPGSHGIATRFVIAAPPHPDPAMLHDLQAQGVRGVRFKISGDADRVRTQLDRVLRYADRIVGCGWHIELQFSNGSALPCDSEWTLMRFPVAICLSGITDVVVRRAPDDPELEFILILLRLGRTWIKLSGAAVTPHEDGAPSRIKTFISGALATRRDRIVWSSGALQARSQQAAADGIAHFTGALATLRQWIPDNADREAVLAANPSQLYGFETAS